MAWLCLWTDILDCPKLAELDDATIGGWILILAATKRHDQNGVVPEIKRLSHWCRRPEMKLRAWISKLEDVGLLDEVDDEVKVHDWTDWQHRSSGSNRSGNAKSDAQRAREYRERQREKHHSVTDVTDVTVPQTPPNTSQTLHHTTLQTNYVTSRDESRDVTVGGLDPEVERTGKIVADMSGEVAWEMWVHNQVRMGVDIKDIQAAIEVCVNKNKWSMSLADGVLKRLARERAETNGKH